MFGLVAKAARAFCVVLLLASPAVTQAEGGLPGPGKPPVGPSAPTAGIAAQTGGRVATSQQQGVFGLGLDGQRLYLLPLGEVAIDPTAADGLRFDSAGNAVVTTQGVGVTLAPSVADLAQLANDLAAVLPDVQVEVRDDGLIVARSGDSAYVVRPDWVAALAADAPAGFAGDAAGQLSYTHGLRRYTLHPAFADLAKLTAAARQAVPGATLQSNADGTVTLTSGENRWTLIPAYTTETAPAGKPAWWADEAGRFWLKNGDGSMQEFRIE